MHRANLPETEGFSEKLGSKVFLGLGLLSIGLCTIVGLSPEIMNMLR